MRLNIGVGLYNAKFAHQIQIHFFLKSEGDLETFQNVSFHVGVIYKLTLKFPKRLNPMFEVVGY